MTTTTTPGIGPRMLHHRPIIPADLHAQLCGWRTRTPDDTSPTWRGAPGAACPCPTPGSS